MMAPVVFAHWGVHSTEDVGNIVFNLIHIDRLSRSDRDDPDEFRDVFDIERVLTDGFEFSTVPVGSRKAAER